MKPLINLKSFVAALLFLIMGCSLLVAYFRNDVPGDGAHEHGHTAKGGGAPEKDDGSHAAPGHGTMPEPQVGPPPSATDTHKDGDHAPIPSRGAEKP